MEHANQVGQDSVPGSPEVKENNKPDPMRRVVQYLVVALFFLVPIFFTPQLWASLSFSKAILVLGLGITALTLLSFQALRKLRVQTVVPLPLLGYWALVLSATTSALLTDGVRKSLRGSMLETQTVAFLAVVGLAMLLPLVFQKSKKMALFSFLSLGSAVVLVLLYNLFRILLGVDFLTFNTFGVATVSPLGAFNDLAIFCGMSIIFSLITLLQIPLKTKLQYLFSGVIFISLFLLSVVNFFNVWIVLGFFAFLVLMFLLARDTLFASEESKPLANGKILMIVTVVICVISVLFIVAGDYMGGKISNMTGVDFVEVRPSTSATIGVMKSVYGENALLGIGPNRFAEAWRLYKDPAINETIFWDTTFDGGNGFVTTLFTNVGLLGVICLLFVHLSYLYLGYKMFLRSKQVDPFWYYFGISSFAVTCFIWGMSYVYVPGATILILGGLFMGLTFVASNALLPDSIKNISLVSNRRRGFVLMTMIICLVVGAVSILFSVSKQYVAEAGFNRATVQATSVEDFEQKAKEAYNLYPDGRFLTAVAQFKLAEMNNLLSLAEPTENDARKFEQVAGEAIMLMNQALETDGSNPSYHALMAGVFSNLTLFGVGEAQERMEQSLKKAMELDPLNPGYKLVSAKLAGRIGDMEKAKAETMSALELKRNFTEALVFLAEIDINQGNTESAINTARTIITLEPNNPARYLQLGLLLSSSNNLDEAELAFKRAVQLDPQYANARFFLAQIYITKEKYEEALNELLVVQKTNEDNVELMAAIEKLRSGDVGTVETSGLNNLVNDQTPSESFESTVTTDGQVNTNLVIPVNTVSETEPNVSEENTEEIIDSPESEQ